MTAVLLLLGLAGAQSGSVPLDPPPDAIKLLPGVSYVVLEPGSGAAHPAAADCVSYEFTARKHDGSLYSSSGPNGAATQCLGAIMPGVARALEAMTVGEKRRIWVSGPLATPPRDMPDDDDAPQIVPLTIDLKLMRILTAPVLPPDGAHPPAGAIPLPSGVFMELIRKGPPHPAAVRRTKIVVHYTAWTQAGKIVETTVMAGRPVTITLETVPLGWRDALPLMNVGDTVRLWVPEEMVSGPQATPLIYQIDVVTAE